MPESSAELGARSFPSMKPAAVSNTTVKRRVTSTNTEPPPDPLWIGVRRVRLDPRGAYLALAGAFAALVAFLAVVFVALATALAGAALAAFLAGALAAAFAGAALEA